MKNENPFLHSISHLFLSLFTHRTSLTAGGIIFSLILFCHLFFHFFLFLPFSQLLTYFSNQPSFQWLTFDAGYGTIVWICVLAMVLSTLTIVITFASQNMPKLIDLYMEEWPTLLFVWLLLLGTVDILLIFTLREIGVPLHSALIFNLHFLLPLCICLAFAYIFYVLQSTKPSNVITRILTHNYTLIEKLTRPSHHALLRQEKVRASIQKSLFEMLNQLHDVLVYVPFKEPKANIVEGIGEVVSFYIEQKNKFSPQLFQVTSVVENDISFLTMKDQLREIEKTQTFYEQKVFRMLGNVYHLFLEEQQFDLSSLCAAKLSQVGQRIVVTDDVALIQLISVRLNTCFRFAMKHGARLNEVRNLYNLSFHYGEFIRSLVIHNQQKALQQCITYLGFYADECFKMTKKVPAFAFILDTISSEMQKVMILLFEQNWGREQQILFLQEFLKLDNHSGVSREYLADFFSKNQGVRIIQIGLALFYLEKKEDDFAHLVIKDTLQDLRFLDEQKFFQVMEVIYARLRFSGAQFWEDTDRGNINIFYTPYPHQIDKFIALQQEYLQ